MLDQTEKSSVTRLPDRWGPRKALINEITRRKTVEVLNCAGRASGLALARPVLSVLESRRSEADAARATLHGAECDHCHLARWRKTLVCAKTKKTEERAK